MMQEFKDFAAKGNVMDMAVGVIIGALIGEVGQVNFATISTRSALAMLYLIVMGALVGFTAFFYLLRHTTPVISSAVRA